jgi:hypothetical protein
MLTLTTSNVKTIKTTPVRPAEQEVRSAKRTVSRPSFLVTLLRALAAAAA